MIFGMLKHAEECLKERFATIPARTGNSVIVFAGKYECLLKSILLEKKNELLQKSVHYALALHYY